MNNKGFTLIEIVVATAVLALVGISVSLGIGSVYHYYVLSNETKQVSDNMYDAIQSENTPADSLDVAAEEATLTYDGDEGEGLKVNVNTYSVKNTKQNLKENVEDIQLTDFSDSSTIENDDDDIPSGPTYSYTVKDRLKTINETVSNVGDTSSNNKGSFDASHGFSDANSDSNCKRRYRVGDFVTYNGKRYYKVQDRFWYTNTINVNDRIYPVSLTDGHYQHYSNGYRIADLIPGYGTGHLQVGKVYYLDPYGGQQKTDNTQDLGITAFVVASDKVTFVLSPGTCFYMDRTTGADIFMFSGWQNVETTDYDEFSSYHAGDLVKVQGSYKRISVLSHPYVGNAEQGSFTVHNEYSDITLTDADKKQWLDSLELSEDDAS